MLIFTPAMAVAASATSSSLKSVNVSATPITQKPTNPSTLTPTWPSVKLTNLILFPSKPVPRTLTLCSTRPGTHMNNEKTGQFFAPDSSSDPTSQHLPTAASIDSVSGSLSLPSSSKGLVFDLGPENSWDCREIGSPVVKRFLSDEEERWYMWYHGSSDENPGSDSIGLAVSSNGIHWERGLGAVNSSGDVGLVMKCGQDWWGFDTMRIRPSEMVVMSSAKVRASSSVYWLYYTGYSSETVDGDDSLRFNLENPEMFWAHNVGSGNGGNGRVLKSLPGLAISQDGRHWARIEGEHHSGALFDVGSERDWDSLFIAGPQVVFHGNGDLRMYYHSFDQKNGEYGIGIARSRDGIKWIKLGKIMGGGKVGSFDEFGVMNACVVRNKKDKKYVMAYEGVGDSGKRSIGLAVSPDGLKEWRRFQDEALLKPSEKDGWDDKGVGSPCLVQMDGDADGWRLYYRGFGNEGRTGIGMAVSQGDDISSFRRWTRFRF